MAVRSPHVNRWLRFVCMPRIRLRDTLTCFHAVPRTCHAMRVLMTFWSSPKSRRLVKISYCHPVTICQSQTIHASLEALRPLHLTQCCFDPAPTLRPGPCGAAAGHVCSLGMPLPSELWPPLHVRRECKRSGRDPRVGAEHVLGRTRSIADL